MNGLTVWYGSMPETNGKSNWTATLCRDGDVTRGFTIARSEYPDRVRYEADCMRYLIGETAEKPDILTYDAVKHSGYVAPPSMDSLYEELREIIDGGSESMTHADALEWCKCMAATAMRRG